MNRFYSYLNSVKSILRQYEGQGPFSKSLKKYFSQHKKFGSKDRKHIGHLCYCYFRLGKAAPPNPPQRGGLSKFDIIEERILLGLFLCSNESNDILATSMPEWNEKVSFPLNEKISFTQFRLQSVFPWENELTEGIEYEKFCESFFQQPDLFLRLRPGKEEIVKEKLRKANINFKTISDTCLALDNTTKVDAILDLDNEVVIQDYNSQQITRFFGYALASPQNDKPTVWDCCAGSGGKSILLYDLNNKIELTVSDVRESILANLKKRFQKAGITKYNSVKADLTNPNFKPQTSNFELIICDAPCTGSGTWGRTPEQLYFFEENKIEEFASLQKKIISNTITHLKQGGYFLYITCSVFRKENEHITDFIEKEFNLRKIKQEILNGYDQKADTMFVALFQKSI